MFIRRSRFEDDTRRMRIETQIIRRASQDRFWRGPSPVPYDHLDLAWHAFLRSEMTFKVIRFLTAVCGARGTLKYRVGYMMRAFFSPVQMLFTTELPRNVTIGGNAQIGAHCSWKGLPAARNSAAASLFRKVIGSVTIRPAGLVRVPGLQEITPSS